MSADTIGEKSIDAFFQAEQKYIENNPIGIPTGLSDIEQPETAPPVLSSACDLRSRGMCPFKSLEIPACDECDPAKQTIEKFSETGQKNGFDRLGSGSLDLSNHAVGQLLINATGDTLEISISGQMQGIHTLASLSPRKKTL